LKIVGVGALGPTVVAAEDEDAGGAGLTKAKPVTSSLPNAKDNSSKLSLERHITGQAWMDTRVGSLAKN
jgi:hypothetical protein